MATTTPTFTQDCLILIREVFPAWNYDLQIAAVEAEPLRCCDFLRGNGLDYLDCRLNAQGNSVIYRLNVNQVGIVGAIPPALGRLVNLEILDISTNPLLTGDLSVLSSLPLLQSLACANTSLAGPVFPLDLPYCDYSNTSLCSDRPTPCLANARGPVAPGQDSGLPTCFDSSLIIGLGVSIGLVVLITVACILTASHGSSEDFSVVVPHMKQRGDELVLGVGDTIVIYEVYRDGWAEGVSRRTGGPPLDEPTTTTPPLSVDDSSALNSVLGTPNTAPPAAAAAAAASLGSNLNNTKKVLTPSPLRSAVTLEDISESEAEEEEESEESGSEVVGGGEPVLESEKPPLPVTKVA
ncbi:hypothetical protein BC829DRAFT_410638 [Chytridium lagenaria]|nr:hypothetical protein BC829DRAFT_410638 [Chytridium lagenaria]